MYPFLDDKIFLEIGVSQVVNFSLKKITSIQHLSELLIVSVCCQMTFSKTLSIYVHLCGMQEQSLYQATALIIEMFLQIEKYIR